MIEWKKLSCIFGQMKNRKAAILILIIGISFMLLPQWKGVESKTPVPHEDETGLYRAEIEHRLTDILSRAEGVGSVEVMVTLEDGGQTFYATNEKSELESAENRSIETAYVFKNEENGKETPVVLKKNLPEISGVLVLAKGAENPTVKANLISAVRAVLGVKAHRIEVLAKK